MTLALILFWLGAVADFWTTRIGFANGFGEANPVVRFVINKLPFSSEVELALLKVVVFVAFWFMHAPAWVFAVLGVFQLAVAYLNFRKLKAASVL